jgi:hypothetical protein
MSQDAQAARRFHQRGGCVWFAWWVALMIPMASASAQDHGPPQPQGESPPQQTASEDEPQTPPLGSNATAPPADGSVGEPDTDKPEPAGETPAAKVIGVGGVVDWAPASTPVLAVEGWTPVAVGDLLTAGTQIRTGLRSHVNLRFGETTYISIRSATYAGIDQLYRTATAERVRIGLGYGTVRGGSSEGEIRGDVVVDSPTATLAKRGTKGWQIFVEAGTGRFQVSLAERGLVEAFQKLRGGRGLSRLVRPGEYTTDRTIATRWFEQEMFTRQVSLFRGAGVTAADAEFAVENSRGLSVLAPGSGLSTETLAARNDADFVLDQIRENPASGALSPTGLQLPRSPLGALLRPEGNFGTPDALSGAGKARPAPSGRR